MRRFLKNISSLLSKMTLNVFKSLKTILTNRRMLTPLWTILSIVITCLAITLITSNMVQRTIIDDKAELVEKNRNESIALIKVNTAVTIKALNDDTETLVRKIMQSVLKGVKSKIEEDIANAPKPLSYKNLADIIYRNTHFIRIYNNEGDYFALNYDTIKGWTFAMDESADCNSPIFAGIPIMDIPNRVRTVFDEVVWQAELIYVLHQAGLIKNDMYDVYMTNKAFKVKYKFKKVDPMLDNAILYTADHVEYIEKTYPELYKYLRSNNIIMHFSPRMAENVLTDMTENGDVQGLNWNFNAPPFKEILEYAPIPEFRGLFGGRYSDPFKSDLPYQKVIVVSGAQIQTMMAEYDDTIKAIKNTEKVSIDAINRQADTNIVTLHKASSVLVYTNHLVVLIIILCMVMTMWLLLGYNSCLVGYDEGVKEE